MRLPRALRTERQAGEIPFYDARAIEEKWVKSWEEQNLFAVDTDSTKPKKYVLEMFPYFG